MCSIETLVMRIQKGDDDDAFVVLEKKLKPLMRLMK